MLLMGLASWKWGAEQQQFSLPVSYKVTYEPIKGFIISEWAVAVFIVAAVIMTFLFLFFKYTKLGTAMRATQQNKHAAKIMGIQTDHVFAFAWAFSSVIGADRRPAFVRQGHSGSSVYDGTVSPGICRCGAGRTHERSRRIDRRCDPGSFGKLFRLCLAGVETDHGFRRDRSGSLYPSQWSFR
ncbi:MAG: hypothetical protein MZV70_23275 [Desulfobacterales bacterium]|nr:hypothetical protein [Desulfobacterales bacterium]